MTGCSEDELFTFMNRVKRHHATLPQDILHGDAHVGNTYQLPGGVGGLYDFQVSVRGFGLRDALYHLVTALSIEERRRHDRDLIASYRERLRAHGVVELPSLEAMWLEARRAAVWGFYCWLPTNLRVWGTEGLTAMLLRVATAFRDYESRKLIEAMP